MKGRMKIVKIVSSYAKFWKILENFNQIENLWKQNVSTQYPEN